MSLGVGAGVRATWRFSQHRVQCSDALLFQGESGGSEESY